MQHLLCRSCERIATVDAKLLALRAELYEWTLVPVNRSSWWVLLALLASSALMVSLRWSYTIVDNVFHLSFHRLVELQPQPESVPASLWTKMLAGKHREIGNLRSEVGALKEQLEAAQAQLRSVDELWIGRMPAYTQRGFWHRFWHDLSMASRRVIIFSPFMSRERVEKLRPALADAVKRGVVLTVITRRFDSNEHQALVELLTSVGVVVTFVDNAHQKLAIIDEDVLWEGSMNVLSHLGTQGEHMRRIRHREIVRRTMNLHNLSS